MKGAAPVTLADRLAHALVDGKTKAGLAKACGIKPPSVSDWFSGKTKTLEGSNLLRAAAYLDVPPLWLAEGKGPMRPRGNEHQMLDIARLDVHVAAGCGNVVEQVDRIGGLSFRRDFLRSVGIYTDNEDESVVLSVKGESMGPWFDGAVILVNKKLRDPVAGKLFVFVDGDGPLIKRMVKVNGLWVARSDNDDKAQYPDTPFKKDNLLIGRAVWMGAKL